MSQLDLKRTFGLIGAPGHNAAQALLADKDGAASERPDAGHPVRLCRLPLQATCTT
jgi:hypothetical protein